MSPAHSSNLSLLLGGYFHEDWAVDDTTHEDVVRRFVRENPRDIVKQARQELAAFLEANHEDAAAASRLLDQEGCRFDPTPLGMTPYDWLRRVSNILKESSGPPG